MKMTEIILIQAFRLLMELLMVGNKYQEQFKKQKNKAFVHIAENVTSTFTYFQG